MAVIVIRYETTDTARWALPFIVRAFFNDTITVAIWTGFHVRLMRMLLSRSVKMSAKCQRQTSHCSSIDRIQPPDPNWTGKRFLSPDGVR
jgi:hypothetical protein